MRDNHSLVHVLYQTQDLLDILDRNLICLKTSVSIL